METFLVSTGVVALGEMGDKTQLLAILLAATLRKPWQIVAGIFTATLINHAAAGIVGEWVAQTLGQDILRWIIGASFLAMAAWMMIPDAIDDATAAATTRLRFGAFGATVIAFFLAEMGDKTQLATVALAARHPHATLTVVMGTTLGMMLADVPAVFLGGKIARKASLKWVHAISAVIFATLGALTLLNPLNTLPGNRATPDNPPPARGAATMQP
jgi:putative Ca2+/H+ antiporter (TMEM165/GDT1 family)